MKVGLWKLKFNNLVSATRYTNKSKSNDIRDS